MESMAAHGKDCVLSGGLFTWQGVQGGARGWGMACKGGQMQLSADMWGVKVQARRVAHQVSWKG